MGCRGSKVVSSDEIDNETIKLGIKSFKLERTIGEGGFGKVNACIFLVTKKWFAIKSMHKSTILKTNGTNMLVCYASLYKR